MKPRSVLVASATSAVLVVLATAGVYWSFRLTAAVLVGALVAAGQRWRLPTATGAGLLGLVVIVGAGPASAAGPLALAAWALPTWAVVLGAAAGHGPDRPTPRETPTRLRLLAGEVAIAGGALPLLVVTTGVGHAAAAWAAAGGAALVGLLLVATGRRTTQLPDA